MSFWGRCCSKSPLFCFLEFVEALPPWKSVISLLRPNQNEPVKHAVLRERRNAAAAPRRHDCGWMRLPVTARTPRSPMKTLSLRGVESSLILVSVHWKSGADLSAEMGFGFLRKDWKMCWNTHSTGDFSWVRETVEHHLQFFTSVNMKCNIPALFLIYTNCVTNVYLL